MKTLEGKVAVVAGASRGAGRGIACGLGEAGATVYCTGRSVRGSTTGNRPETIEETAEMVTARGGVGIPVHMDHLEEEQVRALFQQVEKEQGRLDVLVNVVWGGMVYVTEYGKRFWNVSLDKGFLLLRQAVHAHILATRWALPLMIPRKQGLVVEITDGDGLYYREDVFVDLCKVSAMRLAWALSLELREHGITSLALTPGYMRIELILEHLGVTEANWQDGIAKDPTFAESETPFLIGRAVAALAADPNVAAKAGKTLAGWDLTKEYGLTDVDGRQPDIGPLLEKHFAKAERWEVRL